MAMLLDHSPVHSTDASILAAASADGAGCEAGVDCSAACGPDATDTDIGAKKGKRGTRAKKGSVIAKPAPFDQNAAKTVEVAGPSAGTLMLAEDVGQLKHVVADLSAKHAAMQKRMEYLEDRLATFETVDRNALEPQVE